MSKMIAYIGAATDKQDPNNQKEEILEWARKYDLKVDEFVGITLPSHKTSRQQRIDEVLQTLSDSDTLVVTELSQLGRSVAEVITLINELLKRSIRIIVLKQNLTIDRHDMNLNILTLFSLFAELGRDLVSLHTKEALAVKKTQGVNLGKPKGTLQKSKFDSDAERIKELLQLGLSVRKIAKLLGYSNHLALNTYVNKRKLREQQL